MANKLITDGDASKCIWCRDNAPDYYFNNHAICNKCYGVVVAIVEHSGIVSLIMREAYYDLMDEWRY